MALPNDTTGLSADKVRVLNEKPHIYLGYCVSVFSAFNKVNFNKDKLILSSK